MRPTVESLETRLLLSHPCFLRLEQEPNDAADIATLLPLDCMDVQHNPNHVSGSVTGTLAAAADGAADADYFRFSITEARKLAVVLRGDAAVSGAVAELLAEDGTVLDTTSDGCDSATTADCGSLEYDTASGGSFFVRVVTPNDATTDATGGYILSVVSTRDASVEHEPNDSFETANPIELSLFDPCREVCITTTGSSGAGSGTGAGIAIFPPPPPILRGHMEGELTPRVCPDPCLIAPPPDQDFFSFHVPAGQEIRLELGGPLAGSNGRIVLYDGQQHELASDSDAGDGLAVHWVTNGAADFFVRVDRAPGVHSSDVICSRGPVCLDSNAYRLDVSAAAARNPIEGPDEHEPNDTIETANPLPLYELPLMNCCFEVRSGHVRGIAGGAAGDQDAFRFEVRSGEHVTVFATAEPDFPGSGDANFAVYDSSGTLVGQHAAGAAVSFDADADSVFYAIVSADPVAGQGQLVHYELAVLASRPVASRSHGEHEPNDGFDQANGIPLQESSWGPCGAGICAAQELVLPGGRDGVLRGYVQGNLENGTVPDQPDTDFFRFEVPSARAIGIQLAGPLAGHGGRLTLYGADQHELASDGDPADGLAVRWDAAAAGVFFVRVSGAGAGSSGGATAAGVVASASGYTLKVAADPIPEPVRGAMEQEPNDTFETANVVELHELPLGACCIELRAGGVRGEAGGPTNDQDVFAFKIQAGEHVTVGLAQRADGGHPLAVAVYDAAHNPVGTAGSDGQVSLDADSDGAYYAIVSATSPLGVTAAGAQGYDLHIAARRLLVPVPPPVVIEPFRIVLHAGASFDFTDSDGDRVHVVYGGRSGPATLTFTGPAADGSDIASVLISAARRGRLLIQSDGTADVGSVSIQGARRFGRVEIAGNLGSLTSQVNLKSLAVDGVLGALYADQRTVHRVHAVYFDQVLTRAGSIETIQVNEDPVAAFFKRLWAGQATL